MRSTTVFSACLATAAATVALNSATATATATDENVSVSYGFDCSFAVMTDKFPHDCGLGDKKSFYQEYMDGCREMFGEDDCNNGDFTRRLKNARQPASLLNFTETGFLKIRAPDNVIRLINDFWETNKEHAKQEEWSHANIHTNHWKAPTDFVDVYDEELGGWELSEAISEAAKTTIEEWTGMRQVPTSVYGVRVYKEGAVLSPHCDRMPLISSAIVNVAQDVDEDWPIEVYSHNGTAYNITMKPGDMVLYESGSIIHGRPFPLIGRFYANIFIHFEPTGFLDGRPFVNKDDPELPPYVRAGSPEAEYQYTEYLNARKVEERIDTRVHMAAGDGDIEMLRTIAEENVLELSMIDENGWLPIHEAARMGQVESIKFLLEQDEEFLNRRTHLGEGISPMTIAMKHHGNDHEVVKYLESLDAQIIHWWPNEDLTSEEEHELEEDEDEHDYDGDEDEDEDYDEDDEEDDEEDHEEL
mmetsp:Transcript_6624/g.19438  ORF Transcript_6624/g.19438 Transcript_6624/m.19438 type:complete len:472 (+) Transcript_6624:95-1510(+)